MAFRSEDVKITGNYGSAQRVWDLFAPEKLDAKKDMKELELSPRLLELAIPKKGGFPRATPA